MNNPKVRSLGKRGGQQSQENDAEPKKRGNSFEADEATKDIVRSLFEEYASDDGKNFYTGSKDEQSEKEHEEFLSETDKNLKAESPLNDKIAEEEKAELPAEEKQEEAAAPENRETKQSSKRKKVSVIKSQKSTEEKAAPQNDAEENTEEEETAGTNKKQPTQKAKRKAVDKMKIKKKPEKEIPEKYDDEYEYDDIYDDEDYDDDYEYEDDDDYDYDEYDDDEKGGVAFSLKVIVLSFALIVAILIIIALFAYNRSLSSDLADKSANYNKLLEEYDQKLAEFNQKIDQLQNGTVPEGSSDNTEPSSESSSESENDGSSDDGKYKTYVIQSGDTFAKIAARELGSSKNYPLIEEANPDIDSRSLHVGDEIKIPVTDDNSNNSDSDNNEN